MQEDGKETPEEIDTKLKDIGSTTKSRLDAAINDPEVAKEMAQSAAQKRLEELKALARDPPKPRAKGTRSIEGIESPPRHQERLLKDILRQRLISDHGPDEGHQMSRVLTHEHFEHLRRRRVACA